MTYSTISYVSHNIFVATIIRFLKYKENYRFLIIFYSKFLLILAKKWQTNDDSSKDCNDSFD